MKLTFLLLLLCATAPSAWGWSNHTVGSYLALQELPALRDAPPVAVEPLEQFLTEQYPAVLALFGGGGSASAAGASNQRISRLANFWRRRSPSRLRRAWAAR